MRVGFFTGDITDASFGGGTTFQTAIITALRRATPQHELYIYYRSDRMLFPASEGKMRFVNIVAEINPQTDPNPLNTLAMRDRLELMYYIAPFYEDTVIPFVFTVWDLEHRLHPFFPELSVTGLSFSQREQRYANIIPRAYRTVIGNETGREQVCRYYDIDPERVRAIPLPMADYILETPPDDGILSRCGVHSGEFLFYPAQFWPHKNHIRLVKAMRTLRKWGLKLVFTGNDSGNRGYIEEKIAEYGLQDCIILPGFVNNAEMVSLYRNAFAMPFASFCGPDNLPPLEAMALGCPVICAEFTGAREQLGDCALYFDPRDEQGIIAGVQALGDATLRQRLTTAGRELARGRTTAEYLRQMFVIIDEFAPYRECWSSREFYIHK